ncbi:pimeloyl-CoA dehydrogenase small subunit [Sphingomonas sp. C8-2]|jgi:alkylation response protein AidB-like acyl-CoA dehydrogenase|uniref:Acyl-CoA dehydrogenase n=1 Tax=Rhizorhabdus histidinilytica TaxID=439228 RepID=A0A1T5A4I5_9SPHN|nr:acyl-CoA dehydrogenase family protein [Rhizorhabdus histidinilytica]QEH78257.1 pimeloyl-CoA dehydrogenase small subunit [Sphingomonas sp. C8-2]SKB29890.1 Acyl-CoA dehydrogenase [Rhizorhabdus histidinilytica]
MDFELTDEQKMLSETVTRFVAETYDFSKREHALRSADGWSREAWAALAEMGLLGLPFAEEDGGFGGSGVEMMLIMEALGRGLMVEPYFATVVLAGGVLRHGASAAQRAAIVPGVIAGERILALAHDEAGQARHTLAARTTARPAGDGWIIDGAKIAVIHGQSAGTLIVSATTGEGLGLFLVDARADGVSIEATRGYDGVPVASVRLAGVAVGADALIGEAGTGAAILDRSFDEARAALVAEAVGAMAETFDITVDYLKTRQQFGVAIGSFQALQHRAVDMLMQLELSRSMAVLAALSLDGDADQRRRNIAAAKAQIGKSGRMVGQEAVQMHGAIGITAEYKVGHAFKRLTAIDALLGDRDHHLARLVELGGVYPAE